MGIGIIMKLLLYLYCTTSNIDENGKIKSDMLFALADDHMNDVFSNSGAIIFLAIAVYTIYVNLYLIYIFVNYFLLIINIFDSSNYINYYFI